MTAAAREAIAAARQKIGADSDVPIAETILADARQRLARALRPSLRSVVNATGVILHTNLGRAPVSDESAAAMAAAARGYSNLEFDLETGERGSRTSHLQNLLREVTGAEDGIAVNNNAGALLLSLTALARGREVIVSRGQAVEIGGGFRIPDVMEQSGARLVEVGTTNRTYVADYERAVTTNTALLLRVHSSNFRIEGFVHSVEIRELVDLGRQRGVDVLDDTGSGALLDPRQFGLGAEPLVGDSVRAGATVVCFSGDKLLGGPQAGVIVGTSAALATIRRHPLARALRLDKASIAGLEVTLRHYQRGEATTAIPIWRMIAEPADRLELRCRQIAEGAGSPRVTVVATRSPIGGGSLPLETLPSWALRLAPAPGPDGSGANTLAQQLRRRPVPIVGRVDQGGVLLDLRTVAPVDEPQLLAAIRSVLAGS